MNIITPTPSQAAFIMKKFMEEQGFDVKLNVAQTCVARMSGYASFNAFTAAVELRGAKCPDLSPGNMLDKEGLKLFAITGRVPNDDDDTLNLIWAQAEVDAVESMRKMLCQDGWENYKTGTPESMFITERELVGHVEKGLFILSPAHN